MTQKEAWKTYDTLLDDPRIEFVPEPTIFEKEFRHLSSRSQISPKLWTDDYLAAFAISAGIHLVTFDKALAARTPDAVLLTP